MTRRELVGMASVGVVAIAVVGTYALSSRTASVPEAPDPAFPVRHTDAEWRARLSPAAYDILRHAATEAPFSSPLLAEHRQGLFACAGCGKRLFDARTKYDSHTGWPSFWDTLPGGLISREDRSLGMVRTEVRCADCGGHVGHLFDDGPKPTGLRYCMNGAAMTFTPANS
jgi:peptide-methionine (R)-S-oxide reductase